MFLYQSIVDENKKNPKLSVDRLNDIFLKIVEDLQPTHFIEAGAFEGDTSIKVKRLVPKCSVYAFEANPYNYKNFKPKFDNTDINYLHLAVSNQVGSVTFKVQKEYTNGDPISQIRGNNSILERTSSDIVYEDVQVPCTSLDDFFKEIITDNDSIAMWIDLEGVAYLALTGADNVLSKTKCIKIEVEEHQYWKDQKLAHDIISYLTDKNFIPVVRDFESKLQYNILFCSKDILDKL